MEENLQNLYSVRFSDSEGEKKHKNGTWIEICRYIERRFKCKEKSGVVVDVAAGYCEFINNYTAENTVKRIAIDANPDVVKYAGESVIAICDSIDNLREHFLPGEVQMFFMSNFLEHITKEQIHTLLLDEFELLCSGGEVMILTPNIKYVGEKYWDFFDHITPITDKSLVEEMNAIGYKLIYNISRFLPFTTKCKLPQAQWIVRLYLWLMPISGMIFGKQSLLLFRKE